MLRPRRMSSSNCATASSRPSPTCSPDSSDEHLRPGLVAVDRGEEDAALLGLAELREPVDEAHYSTRSRKTSISPPQGRPTLHARSSSIPYESELGLARREHLLCVLEHVALDAAAGDGAAHLPRLGDREAGADRARSGAPRRDDSRDDDLLAVLLPAIDLGQDLFHAACLLSMPASTAPSSSRLRRLWPGRNRSTNGRAARIPPASGWYSGLPFSGLTQTTAIRCPRELRHLARDEVGIVALPAVGDDDDDRAARQRATPVDRVELGERARRCACRSPSRPRSRSRARAPLPGRAWRGRA